MLKLVFRNISWLSACNVLTAAQTFVVGMWMSRHYGPADYGLYAYALSVVTLLMPIVSMGLPNLMTRELVKRPDDEGRILAVGLLLQLISTTLVFGGLAAFAGRLYAEQEETQVFVLLAALLLYPQTLWSLEAWFNARIESRYPVMARAATSVPAFVLRVVMLLNDAPLITFIWVSIAQSLIETAIVWGQYRWRGGNFHTWRLSWTEMRVLFFSAIPLWVSGFAIGVFTRIDQVMLEAAHGTAEVGYYAVALIFTEGPSFIPTVIAVSVLPALVDLRKVNPTLYPHRAQQFFDLMAWVGLLTAIVVMVVAPWVIQLLLGEAYEPSLRLLWVLSIFLLLVFIAVAQAQYLIAEELQWVLSWVHGLGATLNVVLNLLLIPEYGAMGAAYASLISCVVMVMGIPVVFSASRPCVVMILSTVTAPYRQWASRRT